MNDRTTFTTPLPDDLHVVRSAWRAAPEGTSAAQPCHRLFVLPLREDAASQNIWPDATVLSLANATATIAELDDDSGPLGLIIETGCQGNDALESPTETLVGLMTVLQSLVNHRAGKEVRLLNLCAGSDNTTAAAVDGLLRSLVREVSRWCALSIQGDVNTETLLSALDRFPQSGHFERLRWRSQVCERQVAVNVTVTAPDEMPLSPDGTYLITGGMGGVGQAFAGRLAHRSSNIVICGRSKLGKKQKAVLRALRAQGAKALYVSTDITDPRAVARLIAKVRYRFGALNGIVHAAGLLRDGWLANKDAADIRTVLTTKVDGALNLDAATCDEPLDFFFTCSSLSGQIGNGGQTDYGAANAWLDAFAVWRSQSRPGRSLSIAWPLWADGGMRPRPTRSKRWLKSA